MLVLLCAASMATRPSSALRSSVVIASLAMLTSACITTSDSSVARGRLTIPPASASALQCPPTPEASTNYYYLSFDERMQMEMGIWGRYAVHPRGPNFFRVERDKELEKKWRSACPPKMPQTKK